MRVPVMLVAAAVGFAGCAKNEEQKAQPAASPQVQAQQPVQRKPTQVVVPATVDSGWKAVVVAVKNKASGKDTRYTINIGAALKVPDSEVSIRVEKFLPDFTMEGTLITSRSNEPKNPAAQVIVAEGGKEIFKGWLFARYPTTHAFQHPKYGFTLVESIRNQ